jgi:hypothetical protein
VSYFTKLVIQCPAQVVANWNASAIADLFSGNNLSLRIQPQTYSRIEEGERSKFNDFFSDVGYIRSPQRVGFSVAVADTRDELAIAIKEISAYSVETFVGYRPITVFDFCRVENKADYDRGYTIRTGQIWAENLTGTIQRGTLVCGTPSLEVPEIGRYNNGFTLKFLSLYKQVLG